MQSTFCHSRAARATDQGDARLERAEFHTPDAVRNAPAGLHPELGHRFGDVTVAAHPAIARGMFDDAYLPFNVLHEMSNVWTSSGHNAANFAPENPAALGDPSTWGDSGGSPGAASEQVPDVAAPGAAPIPTPATAGMAFGVGGGAPVGGGLGGLLDMFGGA